MDGLFPMNVEAWGNWGLEGGIVENSGSGVR